MKQQLTFDEMEQIGRKCRRQGTDAAVEISQLSFKEIERIQQDCEQQRSAAIADMFISLYKAIGIRISAVASTLKTGGKAVGVSAR